MVALADAVAYWKAIDYSGSGNWLDGGTGGHDAVPTNTPVFTGGAQPYWAMTAASSHHFVVADHADFEFGASADFSVVAVYQNGANPGASGALIAKRTGLTSASGYVMWLLTGGSLRGGIGDDSTNIVTVFPDADLLPHNQINTVALIRDTTDDAITWMFDGTEYNSTADSTSGSIGVTSNALHFCSDSAASDFFEGRFHGAAVFGSILTTTEVASIGTELLRGGSKMMLLGIA